MQMHNAAESKQCDVHCALTNSCNDEGKHTEKMSSSSAAVDDHVKRLTVEVHDLREQLLETQEQAQHDRASHIAVVNELSLELLELRTLTHAVVEWADAAPTYAQLSAHIDAAWRLEQLKVEERLEQVRRLMNNLLFLHSISLLFFLSFS